MLKVSRTGVLRGSNWSSLTLTDPALILPFCSLLLPDSKITGQDDFGGRPGILN